MLDGLVLAPCDRSAIWLGKTLATLVFLLAAQVVALPAFVLFFSPLDGTALAGVLLANVGICAVGSLMAAMAAAGRARELLLPLLLLPLDALGLGLLCPLELGDLTLKLVPLGAVPGGVVSGSAEFRLLAFHQGPDGRVLDGGEVDASVPSVLLVGLLALLVGRLALTLTVGRLALSGPLLAVGGLPRRTAGVGHSSLLNRSGDKQDSRACQAP